MTICRYTNSAPTEKQRALCEKVGIDIPENATRGEVAQMLSRRLREQSRERANNKRQESVLKIRASNIRVGSIVEYHPTISGVQETRTGVVRYIDYKDDFAIYVHTLAGPSAGRTYSPCIKYLRLLYNPPTGYIHLECANARQENGRSHNYQKDHRLREYLKHYTYAEERFKNIYGMFVSTLAVSRALEHLGYAKTTEE